MVITTATGAIKSSHCMDAENGSALYAMIPVGKYRASVSDASATILRLAAKRKRRNCDGSDERTKK